MEQDRRVWLIIFGALHIVIGLICLLLMLATAVGADRLANGATPPNVGQSLLFDALAAFYFLAVGVGSIRARRWARSIALAVTAIWLIGGIVAFAVLFVVMPHLMVIVPPSNEHQFITAAIVSVLLTMVLLPLVIVLFYRAPSVRATCETHDLTPRWTERTPLPVLALSLALALGAVMMVANLNAKAYFLFGIVLTGAPASIAIVALAFLFGVISVQLFRLRESAWWVLVLLHLVAAVGMVSAFTRGVDVNDFYERTGVMTPQIRAMHLETLTRDPKMWAIIIIGWTAYLAFLIGLRRYFVARRTVVVVT